MAEDTLTHFEQEIRAFIEVAVGLGYDEERVEAIATVMRRNPVELFKSMPTWIPYDRVCMN